MKLVFKTIACLSFLTSFVSNADGCATASFYHEDYVTNLIMVDYELIDERFSFKDYVKGDVAYYFTPGTHTLSLSAINKSYYSMRTNSLNKTRVEKQEEGIGVIQQFTFEPNYFYQFGYDEVSGTIVLQEKKPQVCDLSVPKVVEGSTNDTTLTMSKLPDTLEQQLRSLRLKLYRHYQLSGKQIPAGNIDPLKVTQYFGTVTEESFTSDGHIKILSVLPGSVAFNLGLRTGDEIVSFENNGISINFNDKTPIEALNLYLQIVRENNYHVNLLVKRQGQALPIKGEYKLVFIPASIFSFGDSELLNNIAFDENSLLPQTLQLQYEKMTTDLVNYYSKRDISTEYIQIFRSEENIESLGLEGVLEVGKGVRVELLTEDSPLIALGLQQGDIITAFNQQSVKKSLSPLIQAVSKLNDNDAITLDVIRNNNADSLTGEYKKPFLPQFNLLLNLKSEEKGLALIKFINKRSPFHRFYFARGGVGGTQWKPHATPQQTPGERNRNITK